MEPSYIFTKNSDLGDAKMKNLNSERTIDTLS